MFAAFLALNIDATRLERGAVSLTAGLASKASLPSASDSPATRAHRDKELLAAENYLKSMKAEDFRRLGSLKDIFERFEDIRAKVLSFNTARDARHRLQIRNILRFIREQNESLIVLADKLEATGEVDDGGDVLPTRRDNVCSRISTYRVEHDLSEMVRLFCDMLDTVRQAVIEGEDEEPAAYSVSGLLTTMSMKPDYRQGDIGWDIEQVLGEERRWVAKHLAPRPANTDNSSSPLPEGTKRRFRRWPLRAWETQLWPDAEIDTAALPFKALKEARDVLANAVVEDDLSVSSLRTRIQRVDFCRGRLAQFIFPRGDPAFREQVREVLQKLKERMDALRALAERKVEAGEVDNSDELLPSQRDNICTTLDAYGLEEDFCEDVRKICETWDRLRIIVKDELEKDRAVMEMLGRMIAVRRRPGYLDGSVESELEHLLAEEWAWLAQQGAVIGA